jgi:hypothetical protein
MFGSKEFKKLAKLEVLEMAKESIDPTDDVSITINDIYITSFSFVLGNMKALLSTNLPDGKYYEVTYNKEKREMYTDCYVRLKQHIICDII